MEELVEAYAAYKDIFVVRVNPDVISLDWIGQPLRKPFRKSTLVSGLAGTITIKADESVPLGSFVCEVTERPAEEVAQLKAFREYCEAKREGRQP